MFNVIIPSMRTPNLEELLSIFNLDFLRSYDAGIKINAKIKSEGTRNRISMQFQSYLIPTPLMSASTQKCIFLGQEVRETRRDYVAPISPLPPVRLTQFLP